MIKKIIIIGLIILLICLGGGFFYLNKVYIPKKLKPLVISVLEKTLEKKVSIENAFYFPMKGVLFSKISIINLDKSPFLDIDKVELSLKSLPRLKTSEISAQTKLVIKGITLKQQQLEVKGSTVVDLDAQVKGKEKLSFQATVILEGLEIRGITPLSDITQIKGKIICTQGSISISQLSALINKQKMDIVLESVYDEKSITLEKLVINYGKTKICARGQMLDFNNPQLDVTADGSINLKDVEKILSGRSLPALGGDCRFLAQAKGAALDLDTIKAQVKVDLPQGSIDKIRFSQLNALILLEKSIVNLKPFSVTFYEGQIDALGQADISKADIPVKFSATVQKVNIGLLIKDFLGQDVGTGQFDAQAKVNGSSSDLNSLAGSGWLKLVKANIKIPSNLEGVAKALGVSQLANTQIQEASATFTLSAGKVDTQDLLILANLGTISGKGYVTLEQVVDAELLIKLSAEFVQSVGGLGQLLSFVSDETGAPLAKLKIYDKIPNLKYKIVPLPIKEILKQKVKSGLKEGLESLFKQSGGQDNQEKGGIEKQLREGLKGLFK